MIARFEFHIDVPERFSGSGVKHYEDDRIYIALGNWGCWEDEIYKAGNRVSVLFKSFAIGLEVGGDHVEEYRALDPAEIYEWAWGLLLPLLADKPYVFESIVASAYVDGAREGERNAKSRIREALGIGRGY